MIEELENSIIKINKSLPLTVGRRNSQYYDLFCYINNSYSLLVSKLYNEAFLFLKRANNEIGKLMIQEKVDNEYLLNCVNYVALGINICGGNQNEIY